MGVEENRARARAWYQANKERKKAYDSNYNNDNREKKIAQATEWARRNKDRKRAINKKSYTKHADKKAAYAKNYNQRPEVMARVKERAKFRGRNPIVKERTAHRKLWREYRVTSVAVKGALDLAQHRCGICDQLETRRHLSGKTPRLCIDHDHNTLENRGLLCASCNYILGFVEKNPFFFEQLPKKVEVYLRGSTEILAKIRLLLKRGE